ncbi:MAG: diguanylate cyclase [Methylococcales bacterium]|nr:diguanylate cyclase [Methylococcales bacterium]
MSRSHQLLELIDFSPLKNLFEHFSTLTGLATAIVDLEGNILVASKWQRLCSEFHRVNEKTLKRCIESNQDIYEKLEMGRFCVAQCKNGLVDCASPIVIEDCHIADLFVGQFLMKNSPKIGFFKEQQQLFGFNEKDYFDALAEIPTIHEEKLPMIIAVLVGWAEQIALHTLAEKRALVALESVEQQVKERTEQLRQNNEELQQFFSQPFIGMLTVRCDKRPISVNQRFCEMVGYSREELLNLTCDDITHPDDISLNVYHAQALRGEIDTYRMEKRYIHKDGHIVYVDLAANCVRDAAGNLEYLVGMIQDITERKATEEYIHRLAFYDPLTQLPNRRLLHERLKHSMDVAKRSGTQMAVMMLDLDKFKPVNDSLGHAAGDELLRQVATRLKACLCESDTVARLGGDEFVVVLENIHSTNDVVHLADNIIKTLNAPFKLTLNDDVHIGVSIGITFYPQQGDDCDILIDKADVALYQAKHNGRGRFAYFSENSTAS